MKYMVYVVFHAPTVERGRMGFVCFGHHTYTFGFQLSAYTSDLNILYVYTNIYV